MLDYNIYLNRYLFACRVNSPLVWFSDFPSVELSLVLGTAIAERLPTVQARPWRKSLASWETYLRPFGDKIPALAKRDRKRTSRGKKKKQLPNVPHVKPPEVSWPIEAVLFFYPAKRNYGQGELIFWELKLMGESADHGLFLEVILPALEELGSVTDSRWQYPKGLWGRFDIDSVYMARGPRWEPVVKDGHLDMGYGASPLQWSQGLDFETYCGSQKVFDCLTWLTPFDLSRNHEDKPRNAGRAPTLREISEAFTDRLALLAKGRHHTPDDFWNLLSEKDRSDLQEAVAIASHISVLDKDLQSVATDWPGRWTGTQIFAGAIPDPLLPYLGLASIFHIGRHAHFGCGTFVFD